MEPPLALLVNLYSFRVSHYVRPLLPFFNDYVYIVACFVIDMQPGQSQSHYVFQTAPAPGTIPQYTMPVVMQQGPVIPSNSAATTSQVMPTDQLGSDAGQRKQQEASNVTQSPTESGQGYPPAYSQ